MNAKRCFALSILFLIVGVTPAVLSQDQWESPLKRSLREGKPVVGMTVTVASPDVVVQAAASGFDFVWIEMEHSPITLETARNMVLATRGTPCVPIIRVPFIELWTAKTALDVGALGIVFPNASTPALAKQAVDACKYPPLGKRGYGTGLANARWPTPEPYADFADKNVLVVVLIEQAEAVDRIDAIASVPGVDVLFIGPSDLSYSYGLRGKQDDPKMTNAIAKILAAGKRHKVPVGRPVASPEQAAQFVKDGFLFFQAGSELSFQAAGSRPLLDALGKKPADSRPRALY
jgi:2-keto-3-deoxy-L-rhamnonate aldolase RhmA